MIGAEPKVLLDNYIQLLEEKFMDQSKIAQVARAIYKQHRQALDVLFEHRPDNLQNLSEDIRKLLEQEIKELGFVMTACSKHYIRFVPKQWIQRGNLHGTGWAYSPHTVLFEISLRAKKPTLSVISGKAPSPWIDKLWERAQSHPFQMLGKRTERPRDWVMLHSLGKSNTLINDEPTGDVGDISTQIVNWCKNHLKADSSREVVTIIADALPALEEYHNSTQS